MLNAAAKEDLKNSVLCWLATVDSNGQPNVSPKEIFCVDGDDAIMIAEIALPMSAQNIANNSKVCVSFVDIFKQRGFKIKGIANFLLPENPLFAAKGAPLIEMAGSDYKVRSIFHIIITRVDRIWAPSYARFPERTTEEHVARTLKNYGVAMPQTAK
jgi:uncharacterized protein